MHTISVSLMICTGCPKSHAPSFMNYILRYENNIAIKEVCLDGVTLQNVLGYHSIDNLLNELPDNYSDK